MTDPDGSQKIDHLSDHGHWKLTPASIADYTYNLTIQGSNFTDEPEFEITNPDGLRLLVRDDFSNPWQFLGSHGTGAASPPSVSRTGISQFGVVAMGGLHSENPLPVELTRFNAQQQNNKVLLTWETASECQNDYFTVYRATDGINFTEIARINGAGNSTQQKEYNYTDPACNIGINYYYLEQTDFDGTVSKSTVETVTVAPVQNWNAHVSNHQIHIQLPANEIQNIQYQLIKITGRIVQDGHLQLHPGKTLTIPVNTQGIHILSIQTENGTKHSKKIFVY